MRYIDFFHLRAAARQARHQLGRDHRAMRPQLHPVEFVALEQFEAAIDIANCDSEQNAHQPAPRHPVYPAHQRIGATSASACDYIVLGNERRHQLDISRIELPVAVAQQHVWFRRRANS